MNPENVRRIVDRLNNITESVRKQVSGADVHAVNNIRHTAQLLIDQLETDPDCIDDELVNQILRNTEARLIEFYQKKYPPHKLFS